MSAKIIVVLFALFFGSDGWDKDQSNWTPIMKWTYKADYKEILKLINGGTSINEENSEGWTALKVAVKKGKITVVRFLLANSADPNKGDKDKMTPLLESCLANDYSIAETLIQGGADINRSLDNGYSPLMAATFWADVKLMKLLLDNGAAIDAERKSDKWTALTFAREKKDKNKLELLGKYGAKSMLFFMLIKMDYRLSKIKNFEYCQ